KEKLPIADLFGIYTLERLFDLASAAVIAAVGLLLFQAHGHVGETAGKLETAARTTGSVLSAGVVGAIAFLIYLRLHGSALLQRRLAGRGVPCLHSSVWSRKRGRRCCIDCYVADYLCSV